MRGEITKRSKGSDESFVFEECHGEWSIDRGKVKLSFYYKGMVCEVLFPLFCV